MSIERMTEAELEEYKLHRRFDRMGRLVGDETMNRLAKAHVMVVGLGGVGSWAAEAMVRSGVGEITLVDFDEICVTNVNRQLHALSGLVGKPKADVMAERMRLINPAVRINGFRQFFNEETCASIFERSPDYVIDAIDNVTTKCFLLAYCRKKQIPVVCSTGSGGRLDPTQVQVMDLAFTTVDPLAREVRKILRTRYDFPKLLTEPWNIPAVVSLEPHQVPVDLHYDGGKGFRCVCPQGDNPYNTCDDKNMIMGNAVFVTGTFGFVAASVVVQAIVTQSLRPNPDSQA